MPPDNPSISSTQKAGNNSRTNYFCPLCLKAITKEDKFWVSTPEERDNGEAPTQISGGDLKPTLERDARNYRNIQFGIYLAHAGCTRLNPFEDKGTINFGDTSSPNRGKHKSTSVEAKHYEIEILRALPANILEMWFPAALLIVTQTDPTKKQGRIAILVGHTNVGKSVLAVQAMHKDGIQNDSNSESVDVVCQHYAYAPTYVRFAQCVNSIQSILDGSPPVPVGKTVPELGEMRAVFYTVGHDVPVRSSGLLDSFLSRSARMKGTENTYENYRPIIFYDVAGETFIDNLLALQRHYLVADKVAFVVNAGSLFPMVKPGNAASGEPTIEAADPAAIVTAMSQIDRLRTMPNAPEWCLVITQMDKFRLTFGEEQWSRIEFFAENESIDPYAGTSSNGTPLELLKELTGTERPREVSNLFTRLAVAKKHTRSQLTKRPEIFFVWTDNLGPAKPGPKRVPSSHGLGRFVAWCLDEPLDVINHLAPPPVSKRR